MKKRPMNGLKSDRWMIVDNFAGGGGASTGIEMAIGRSPDVAINHNAEALAMHAANHPETRHYATDVFEIDPRVVVRNQRVGLAWFSPDCTHHSKARGGKPIRDSGKKSRSLAWVVVRWAEQVRPRVIMLENVEEFEQWGPLVPKVGDDGEPQFTPDGTPWYVPCPQRVGKTFRAWKRKLERLGYVVELKQLRACDYGAPTVRKRLFVIARCDGQPIQWPEPTHGKPDSPEVQSGTRLPWRTAAEIIDWSRPCHSIFLTTEEAKPIGVIRPLADNTMKRIAAGLKRYVLDAAKPFIVYCNHGGDGFRGRGVDQPMATATCSRDAAGLVMPFVSAAQHGGTNRDIGIPLHTITASTKDQNCVVSPFLASPAHSKTTGRGPNVWDLHEPLRTTTSSNDKCVVAPVLSREFGKASGVSIEQPLPTVMSTGQGKTALVEAFIAQHNGGMVGHDARRPLSTITQRGTQQQVVEVDLSQPVNCLTSGGNHVAHVMAFLSKYYGSEHNHQSCGEPVHTVPTRDRFGLVLVNGVDYQIVDIGMRMLTARELFRAQGFPDSYKIDVLAPNASGKLRPMPKDAQVRMCGNSVCPDLAAALVKANCPWLKEPQRTTTQARQLELAGV